MNENIPRILYWILLFLKLINLQTHFIEDVHVEGPTYTHFNVFISIIYKDIVQTV